MEMKIFEEDQILNEEFRAEVIKEIEGDENTTRKRDKFKQYELYRDRIKKYVVEILQNELEDETVVEMVNRISIINIYKKCVNKKARVYKDAPERSSLEENEIFDAQISMIEKRFKLNTVLKKVNRYVEAFRNAELAILPYTDHKTGMKKLMLRVLAPYQYDVIEDSQNNEIPRVYIMSNFRPEGSDSVVGLSSSDGDGRGINRQSVSGFRSGDGINQTIADSPIDKENADNKHYVWWSDTYHFTTNAQGEIIPGMQDEDLSNPIGQIPIVSYAKDRDGSFWAVGGEDLSEGCVLTNILMSDNFFITKIQGMGVFYFFGKDAPRKMRIGPNHAVTGSLEDGDPTPIIGFASSSPPLNEHRLNVEQYIAMLLTTNDLGVSAVSGKLENASSTSSGIHELIQNSEPLTAIEDEQAIYLQNEPKIFEITAGWIDAFKQSGELHPELEEIGQFPQDVKVITKFNAVEHFTSDKDKVASIKERMDIGIFNIVDAAVKDNPEITRKEALDGALMRLKEDQTINAEKLKSVIEKLNINMGEENSEENDSDGAESNEEN